MITEGGEAMDMLLEFIMELVMEGTVYTAQNKKVSLWIRIPLILVLVLFFGFIIIGCFLVGVAIMRAVGFFKGLTMIAISLFILFGILKQVYDYRKGQ